MKLSALVMFMFANGLVFAERSSGQNTQLEEPKACRSVHLDFPAKEATAFCNELTITDFGDGTVRGRRLRILSYNIKHGRGNDNQVDLERTASVIRRLNPDIVALQEVDKNVRRSGNVDEPAVLSKLTGLPHHAFGPFFEFQGGEYGMAVLSRLPIRESTNLRLPEGAEPRTSLVVKIASSSTEDLTIADVHFYRTEAERLAQARMLLDHLEKIPGEIVIVGDFNSTPGSSVMNLFQPNWENPDKGEDRFTFSSDHPDREIDFAMTQRKSRWSISAIDVIDEPLASDHRPLVLEIDFKD